MCIRTSEAKNVVQRAVSLRGTNEAFARKLCVNSAHIHKLLTQDNLTPTLENALVRLGYLEPKPTRTRLAIDCDEATRQWFRDEAARRGISGEAFLLYMREVLGWRKG